MAGEEILKTFLPNQCQDANPPPVKKKKRNLPGTPDPEAEVIALSPKALLATNRFLCEICGKGFQRDQNLQLHRRGHNLPWKLRQRSTKEPRKRVYVCPEKSCIHHHPSRALGDLTGIKKHFCRKHGEKKWKCEKCSKRYAVQSDWKAHSKTCGTREYRCDCGTLFSRKDSFITHRAFCDALAEETARLCAAAPNMSHMMPSGGGGYRLSRPPMRHNLVQHFSSIFKPVMPSAAAAADHGGPGSVSLWSVQGVPLSGELMRNNANPSDINPLGALSPASLLGDPFASCSNPPQLDYQLSCIYSNRMPPSTSGELMSTSIPTSNMKEAGAGQHHLLESAPSLYSSQHQQHSIPASETSATALLQKAARVGVASGDPSLIVWSLEAKGHSLHGQEAGNYDSLFTTSRATGFNPGFGNSLLEISPGSHFPVLSHHEAFPTKHQVSHKDDLGGGQTRDFLGVGVQALCPPSIHGWI